MNGLISFLTLLSWYKDRKPRKYHNIKSAIKHFVTAINYINEELRNMLNDNKIDPLTVEILYNALFKNPHESELISAAYEFMKYAEELEIFNKRELEEINNILKDFQNLVALVANVYHTMQEGGRRKYVSLEESWKEL